MPTRVVEECRRLAHKVPSLEAGGKEVPDEGCHQGSSEAIRGHRRPSEAIGPRLSEAIREAIRGHQWRLAYLASLRRILKPAPSCKLISSSIESSRTWM